MQPGPRHLTIYRGDIYEHVITFTDAAGATFDVSGTWRAQIRTFGDEFLASFAVDDTDAASGELTISLTKVETAALPAGEHHWDIEETDAGKTYLAGNVTVKGQVSQAVSP